MFIRKNTKGHQENIPMEMRNWDICTQALWENSGLYVPAGGLGVGDVVVGRMQDLGSRVGIRPTRTLVTLAWVEVVCEQQKNSQLKSYLQL